MIIAEDRQTLYSLDYEFVAGKISHSSSMRRFDLMERIKKSYTRDV